MQLRIGYLTAIYPRATDTFIQREVAALRRRGVHVGTFSVRPPSEKEIVGPEQAAERAGTAYVLPPTFGKFVGAPLAMLFSHPIRFAKSIRTAIKLHPGGIKPAIMQTVYWLEAAVIARRMKKDGLQHLHAHFSSHPGTVALLAAQMGGFTYSLTVHGPAEFFAPRFWRMDEKAKRALFVSCISHFCRSQVMCYAPQNKWDRLHIVHCGVEPALFQPVRHQGEGTRLLFVGRLAGVKGLPVMLQAMAELKRRRPDIKLTVAGDGPERKSLEAMAERLGVKDRVDFLGYRSQSQVRELLAQTDVFVLASFAEGVPVVLMEAMAAGVPVVSSHIAGIPELVEDGVSGYLVPPGDPAALVERVDELLGDAALRNRLGAEGRRKVERDYNIAVEAERLSYIMTNALEGRVVDTRPLVSSDADYVPTDGLVPQRTSLTPRARMAV
jgi:glycosyltransferase involved in cell wall biosynthesis